MKLCQYPVSHCADEASATPTARCAEAGREAADAAGLVEAMATGATRVNDDSTVTVAKRARRTALCDWFMR
ncbi:hypothetical protein GCM10010401_14710 [Rarobacter faecitabidus]